MSNLKKRILTSIIVFPLSMYFKAGYVKIEFGLAQGKKLWDKRKTKMEKDVSRQIDRELKKAPCLVWP